MELNYIWAVWIRVRNIFRITIALLIMAANTVSGQNSRDEIPSLKERMFYGGSFGLQLGSVTDIEISPIIGLWVLPRLAVAVGPDYRYYKDPYSLTDIYGGSGYVQLVVIKDINTFIPLGSHTGFFLHAEDELLSLKSSFWKLPPYTSKRFFINTLLAGIGISQQLGRRSSLNFMVLWALNDSEYDLYSNPEIRVSFVF